MFERIADHTKVNLVKRDVNFQQNYFGAKDLLPFWVADMDFETTPEVKKALNQRVEKGIFGYEMNSEGLKQSVIDWFNRRHNWKMNNQFLRTSPSIMTSIGVLIKLLTNEGDKVLVQTPAFPKFLQVVPNNNRTLLENPLKLINNKYEINFEDFEKKAKEAKLFILCNPHNPAGRVWKKEELKRLSKIASENNMYVISDEIHSDIIFKGNKFIPYGDLPKELTQMSISLLSPAKSFNLPSISSSFLYSKNKEVLEKFDNFMQSMYLGSTSILDLIAMQTAYNTGDKWLDKLLVHVEDNINFAITYIEEYIPKLQVIKPEGMYLIWINFKELNIEDKEFNQLLVNNGIALNPGFWFGKDGNGFLRMNLATSKKTTLQGLEKLKSTVDTLIK